MKSHIKHNSISITSGKVTFHNPLNHSALEDHSYNDLSGYVHN